MYHGILALEGCGVWYIWRCCSQKKELGAQEHTCVTSVPQTYVVCGGIDVWNIELLLIYTYTHVFPFNSFGGTLIFTLSFLSWS